MLKVKLEVAEDQARIVAALVVSKFLASEEMTKIKGYSYDDAIQDFLYAVSTDQPD